MADDWDARVLSLLSEYCGEPVTDPEENLFDAGLLDSLGLAEILELAEDRWDVEIYPTQYPREALSTARGLAEAVRRERR